MRRDQGPPRRELGLGVPLLREAFAGLNGARRSRRREVLRCSLRKRRRARKEEIVQARGGRCLDCGYSACIAALDFHHRDPATKDFAVGGFHGATARLMTEVEKCDLLCAV